MLSDLEADRLLAAALRAADPITAARMVAEAFLAVSRTADPATLTVAYTYEYRLRSGRTREEDVSLRLEFDPSTQTYLIAGDGAT